MRKYRRKSDYQGCDPNTHSVLLPMTQNEADRLHLWFVNTLSAVDPDTPFQAFLEKLSRRLDRARKQ
jgi:hypothetical protein